MQDVAIITFQTMCYVLKNYTLENCCDEATKSSPVKRISSYRLLLDGDPIVEKPILLASLLDGLTVLATKFKLKWQECVETICILSLARSILDHSGVQPTVIK